jgi:hypothetical protein
VVTETIFIPNMFVEQRAPAAPSLDPDVNSIDNGVGVPSPWFGRDVLVPKICIKRSTAKNDTELPLSNRFSAIRTALCLLAKKGLDMRHGVVDAYHHQDDYYQIYDSYCHNNRGRQRPARLQSREHTILA